MFKYYNANPLGRNVNDCTVRAFALATDQSWEEAYDMLANSAKKECITFSEMDFINEFLKKNYCMYKLPRGVYQLQDFLDLKLKGRWLITMPNHITCVIDGVCYDTFDPSEKFVWCAYQIK